MEVSVTSMAKSNHKKLAMFLLKQFIPNFDCFMVTKEIDITYLTSYLEFSQQFYYFFDSYNTTQWCFITTLNVSIEEVLIFPHELYLLLIAFILDSFSFGCSLLCIHLLYDPYRLSSIRFFIHFLALICLLWA